jgi:transcriptional regulator with XRE-family HTH domain
MVMTTGFLAGYEGSGSYYEKTVPYLKSNNWEVRPPYESPFARDLIFGSGPLQSALYDVGTKIAVEMPLTAHQKVLQIVAFFGLSKSQLARVLGVSRPTLYAWLDGSATPQADNLERIAVLYSILKASTWNQNRPLFHEYVTEKLTGEPRSLLELLSDPVVDLDSAAILAEKVWALTTERDRRLEEAVTKTNLREDAFLDNLTALGTEG